MLPWCGQENLYLYLHTKLIRNTVSFLGQQLQIWRPHESLRFYPTQLIRRDSARNCGLIRVKWNNNTYSMVQSPSWEANWFAASQRNHPACERFLTLIFYREGLLAPLPTPPPPPPPAHPPPPPPKKPAPPGGGGGGGGGAQSVEWLRIARPRNHGSVSGR